MKRIRNRVIGGIQSKVMALVLLSMLLLAVVFGIFTLVHSNELSRLTRETSERQLASVTGTTSEVIHTDILFFYTDGVPEATNARQELFATDRMLSALNKHPEASPQDVLENMRHAVDGFVQDAEQFDDLTMLCLEYKGPEAKGSDAT